MPVSSTFTANVTAGPEASTAWVHLVGDVDLAADIDLGAVVDQLSSARPRTVCIDLGGVTFGGTTLVNFLIRAKIASQSDAPLVLWRAPPMVRHVLDAIGLDAIAVLGENPSPAMSPPRA